MVFGVTAGTPSDRQLGARETADGKRSPRAGGAKRDICLQSGLASTFSLLGEAIMRDEGRHGRRSEYHSILQRAAFEPGDEQHGGWPRAALMRMDARFCAAMERAIARGLERPPDGEAPER